MPGLFLFKRNFMKQVLLILSLLFFTSGVFAQTIQPLSQDEEKTFDYSSQRSLPMGMESKALMDGPGDLLIYFFPADYPLQDVDSVTVSLGEKTYQFNRLSPFLIKGLEEETQVDVVMYEGGDTLEFQASGKPVLSATVKMAPKPIVTDDSITFGLLAIVLALIFFTANSQRSGWKRFYGVVPALLLCYLIPGLLSTFGIISAEYSSLYSAAKTYLLPAALILMTIGIDFKGILNLGPKALIMFFTGTIGIIIGGPLSILIYTWISPEVVGGVAEEATWRGMATLAGSWIGGGANQMAMLELYDYKKSMFGKMITVDIVVAQLWMIFLLWGAARHKMFDKWLKADGSAIEDLKNRMENYEAETSRKPVLKDYMLMLGLTFGLVGLAHWLSSYLGPFFENLWGDTSPLASKFFWLILICTVGALIYAATRARRYEGAGASKLGSVFIYILVAVIGMKMDIGKAFEEPQLIAVGAIWMLIHAILLFAVAKWIKAPFFFLAVGSKANVGGAASAPVVAAAFHPSLASVGVLLAVVGYAVGSIAAILCAELMGWVAPI
ncbi:MAG: hypothetical protein Crog3KO_05960 [Crocinitomicaceae bacterium]